MAATNTPANPVTAAPDLAETRAAVLATSAKGRQAMVALGLAALATVAELFVSRVAPFVSPGWWVSVLLYSAGVVRLAALVLGCQWVYRAHADVARLGGPPVVRPSVAVWAFFIPVYNLYAPYRVLRDLYAASDPATLHDPPQYKAVAGTQYRSSGLERIAPPAYDLWFPLRAVWATYVIIPVVLAIAAFLLAWVSPTAEALLLPNPVATAVNGVMEAAAGVLAIAVVRSIVARQRERLRRLEAQAASDGAFDVGTAVHAGFESPVRVEASGPRVTEPATVESEAVDEAPGAARRAGR